MRAVVIDLEATCWENDPEQKNKSEVIEVGAVGVTDDSADEWEFQTYIKPCKYPELSEYCINLTGITQKKVDDAPLAAVAYETFIQWIHDHKLQKSTMVSWGKYDLTKLRNEMSYHHLSFPFKSHINLKDCFALWEGGRSKGLAKAIESLGWTFEGRHHSGIDDTRNTAKILKFLKEKAPHVLVPRRF